MKPACQLGSTLLWLTGAFAMADQPESPTDDRIAQARQHCAAILRARCQKAGLAYPPREIFLRGFKREAELEVWARDGQAPFQKLITYPVLAASGVAGPKRRQGDYQVPEGFYRIEVFNPKSRFHLSLGLNYPNASDRVLSDPAFPGNEIYIHGGALSAGCLALGDPAIEELFLLAYDTAQAGQTEIAVHLFPTRMHGADWESFRHRETATHPELAAFWAGLQPGYDAFERDRQVPRMGVEATGAYVLRP